MYMFNAEDPGQSLYTPTTVGVIEKVLFITYSNECSTEVNINGIY